METGRTVGGIAPACGLCQGRGWVWTDGIGPDGFSHTEECACREPGDEAHARMLSDWDRYGDLTPAHR